MVKSILTDIPYSFYFLRHGQTRWNLDMRLQGSIDIPLNATGLQQAESARPLLQGLAPTAVISSTQFRAVRTAEIILQDSPLPLIQHPDLCERRFGAWEGFRVYADLALPMSKPTANTVPHLEHHIIPPGGEDWPTFQCRALTAVQDVVQTYGPRCLIVSHGYVFVALAEALLGQDIMCQNCIPYLFEKTTDKTPDKTPTKISAGWQLTTVSATL